MDIRTVYGNKDTATVPRVITAYKTSRSFNKAIVDHTSPALCTPITPFPADIKWSLLQQTRYNALSMGRKPQNYPFPLGFRHPARGGPTHGHQQHAQKLVKIAPVALEICSRTDRQTHRHTERQVCSSEYFATAVAWCFLPMKARKTMTSSRVSMFPTIVTRLRYRMISKGCCSCCDFSVWRFAINWTMTTWTRPGCYGTAGAGCYLPVCQDNNARR